MHKCKYAGTHFKHINMAADIYICVHTLNMRVYTPFLYTYMLIMVKYVYADVTVAYSNYAWNAI